jgi:hypothetical protein
LRRAAPGIVLALAICGCGAPALVPPSVPSPTVAAPTLDPAKVAAGQPRPGDAALAVDVARRYEDAVAARKWDAAWALLAPEQQAMRTSREEFADERGAFMTSTGGVYVARPPTHDPAEIRRWVVPEDLTRPIYPVTPDYDRAFLVEVDFPRLAGNNAGWEMLLVAPIKDGSWFIWVIR